jgi:hypothetical protein
MLNRLLTVCPPSGFRYLESLGDGQRRLIETTWTPELVAGDALNLRHLVRAATPIHRRRSVALRRADFNFVKGAAVHAVRVFQVKREPCRFSLRVDFGIEQNWFCRTHLSDSHAR